MLAILLPVVRRHLQRFQSAGLFYFARTCFPPLWLPYAWVFWCLRFNADARMVKKALAVALGCGSLIFLLCSFLLYVTPFDADRRSAIAYALVLVLQIALIVSTVAAYYSMKREPHDLQILATRLWIPIVGIAAAAIVVPNIFMQERAPNEAYSVGSLRTINTAQVYYSQTHPEKGFANFSY